MVIVTTMGGLAATGISYVSSMNTITAQRAELTRMWQKVHDLSSAVASSGRQFAPRIEDPISKGIYSTYYFKLPPFLFLQEFSE